MINKYTNQHNYCPNCRSQIIDYIGTQAFCSQCLRFASNLQQELKVVPEQYESNARNRRELDKDRRYNALIREFSDKHRELRSKEELEVYRQKLRAIKAVTPNCKGSREAAAAVVYCMMQEQIKMTIREYCKGNNLSVKLFNQKYKLYKQIQKKEPQQSLFYQPQPQLFLKQEQNDNKLEESPTERESDNEENFYSASLPGRDEEQEELTLVERAKHAILLIYDQLFNKYIYKEKKTLVVKGLIQKFEAISKNILTLINYWQNTPLKIYYLIFAVIKNLSHKITFAQYAQIIFKETGYILKRKPAVEIKKVYQAHSEEGSEGIGQNEVKIEDNGTRNTIREYQPEVVRKERKSRKSAKKEKERVDLSDSELNF